MRIRISFALALRRAGNLLLGSERKQRLRVARMLLTALVYLLSLAVAHYAVAFHMATPHSERYLQAYILPGLLLFYALLRSGLSLRFNDPSLAMAQSVFAIGAILLAYGSVGPARGAVLMLLPLVSVFGMLSLRPRDTVMLGLVAVGALAILMYWLAHSSPERFDPHLETIFFVLAATILLTQSWVAKYISDLRDRLREQRAALTEALQKLEEVVIRDELTGLFNRRHMQQLLDTHCRLGARSGTPFCVALLDLDHFKRINDEYGHLVGDDALRGFARCATRTLREVDVLGRWGGEEFLVLLPGVDAQQAVTAMERLRGALKEFRLSPAAPELRVCFSAGISQFGKGGNTAQLIEWADIALYDAKAAGRNRSLIGDPQAA